MADADAATGGSSRNRWLIGLLALAAAGLGVRLTYLFGWQNPGHVVGDTFYYHYGANYFADGRGFPNPFMLLQRGQYTPDAQHPPLTIILLAIPSLFGLTTYLDHQVFSCLLGTASIVVVGLAGRRIAGPRTGLVAAFIAAVYPGFWLNDPVVLSETPAILTCSLTVLAAYRFADRRGMLDAVLLGLAVAADILVRAELALLAVFVIVPLVLRARPATWRRRVGLLAAAGAACVVVMAPWVGYNLSRFKEPEYISTGLGSTLAVANCPATYYGPLTGWWQYTCGSADIPAGDFSQKDVSYRKSSETFIRQHASALPRVVLAREGRTWGFYHPGQQMVIDQIEYRKFDANRAGLVMMYVLALLSVAGVVVLWRRRVTVLPLLALPAAVTVSAAIIYGNTRFRSAAEPALVLLAAVALDAALRAVAARRRRPEPSGGAGPSGAAGSVAAVADDRDGQRV